MNLHELVIRSAQQHPDRTAVAAVGRELTYRELDRGADEFARLLAAAGVGRGDRVVIWGDKSPEVIVAMQAALRLGAVYVPQDGTAPVGRIVTVAGDCAARVVCATGDRLKEVTAVLGTVPALDLAQAAAPTGAAPAPAVHTETKPDEPAFILYTSGSTGTPKGVSISHRNARAFVDWAVELLGAGPDDRFANHAPLVFDLSVLDLYAAFSVGASVRLVPAALAYAPGELVAFLHREAITVWYSVPSALILMIRGGGLLDRPAPQGLRAVLFAGEPFPIAHVRRLAAWTDARLLNLYGPTETNVCTWHEVVPADLERERPVPIGRAASGDEVWARTDTGAVAAPGEQGELVVSGPTVMLGYWGRGPASEAYATGDIVTVLPDGGFDYVGRRDHAVKVRGHRIELGEIETTANAHADVETTAVVVAGEGMDARLVAFVVPAAGARPGLLALRRHLAERLPSYMIADHIHLLPDLPRTRNGKIDRPELVRRHLTLSKGRS
ncbi:amino acid adenylation domain-containing protein [Streptomyces sp. VRA16 Mangrove soil]|uniref:amino acid adenylation domain-containing protein n=1 Tax=Streptomyces sp. VRA16 Mangrove soil TaxID=2817434 RepID=UPI001A9E6E6F|nr:amino acid adenylation domain-containing protein [Streptomyces sp. VRA16 Mangrove soil]MBO1334093.1 amino acid adenylation domain-containing protein [Streptomyces sp. VRA16 Mangrove soil]